MRDALSILDQLLSYEKDSINYNDALQITGFAAREKIEAILLALLNEDAGNALIQTQSALADGASSKNILDELIDLATNALMVNKANDNENSSNFLTKDFAERIKDISSERYFNLIKLANNALNDLRYTNQQQIPLEVFLVAASQKINVLDENPIPVQAPEVKPVSANGNTDLQAEVAALKKQVIDLTRQVSSLSNQPVNNTSSKSNVVFHMDNEEKKTTVHKQTKNIQPELIKKAKKVKKTPDQNRKQVYHVLENATKQDLVAIKDVWPDLKSVLEVSEKALLDVLEPVAASSDQVVMKCKYTLWFEKASSDSDLLSKLTGYIEKFTKNSYSIVLVPDNDWMAVRSEFVQSHKEELLAKKKQKIEAIQEEKTDQEESKGDPEVINKAKALFGDTVNIKD